MTNSNENSCLTWAIEKFNSKVSEKDQIKIDENLMLRQGALSEAIDLSVVKNILDVSEIVNKAHFNLQLAPKSGAWLNTLPCDSLGNHIPGVLFSIMLKRRLRSEIYSKSDHCMLCDQVMDVHGDHALVCSTNGDRIYRHNALRNKALHFCEQARLKPELEKKGLLDSNTKTKCRPADIYIPNFFASQQTALDFGVTSGLRSALLQFSSENNRFATEEYSEFKKNNLDTEQNCKNMDIKFIPMVIEGSAGSWRVEAELVWKLIIRSTASLTGEPISLVQIISIKVCLWFCIKLMVEHY